MARLRYDLVSTELASAVNAVAGSVSLDAPFVAADGPVPTLGAGDYFVIVVEREIMYVTGYTAGQTVATVERGKEGTTAAVHQSGSVVTHAPTATDFDAFHGKSLEFDWQGTQLGVRQEGDPNYQYQDLEGDPGAPGSPGIEIGATPPGDTTKLWLDTSTVAVPNLVETHVAWGPQSLSGDGTWQSFWNPIIVDLRRFTHISEVVLYADVTSSGADGTNGDVELRLMDIAAGQELDPATLLTANVAQYQHSFDHESGDVQQLIGTTGRRLLGLQAKLPSGGQVDLAYSAIVIRSGV